MELVARCPACDARLPVNAADPVAAIRCGRCGRDIALSITDAVRDDRAVDHCPV
jgi:DNA-directed RNA polymerase subunit RPC12/RpoP